MKTLSFVSALERQARAMAVGHPGDHPGHRQELDVPADRAALIVGGDVAVLHLAACLARGEVEHAQHPGEVAAGGVLGEIVAIRFDDAGVDGADGAQAGGLGVHADGLRHAADEVVETQGFEQPAVDQGIDLRRPSAGRPLEPLDRAGETLLAGASEKLGERHRPQVQVLHPSHRHGEGTLGQRELHQGARGDHGAIRHVLQEVAKRCEGAGGRLYLVDEQHASGRQRRVRHRLDQVEQRGRVGAGPAERFGEVGMPFQIDGHEVPAGGLAEELDQRGLAHLPRPANDQRLAPGAAQPALQGV